jgi:hypothetical protein
MFKHRNGQDYRYLTKLLSEVPQSVSYNHHKFQKFECDNMTPTTCGRHVILRLLNKHKNLEAYKKEFDQTRDQGGYAGYDECVVALVDNPNWH